MARERVSILNLLRASEIFLNEYDDYSQSEEHLLRAMLDRLSARVNQGDDREDPPDRRSMAS